MPTNLREATRTARKAHRCGMCDAVIKAGEKHHVSTNIFDDRVYDFRTCAACERDGILNEVYDWAGMPSEGVTEESAWEWAHENADYTEESGPMARRWLARNGCDCEDCASRNESAQTTAQPRPGRAPRVEPSHHPHPGGRPMSEQTGVGPEQREQWRRDAAPNPQARRGYRERDERIRALLDALDAAEHERDRLRNWKQQAIPLFDGLQDLGRALDLPLGVLVTGPTAIEAANALRAERDAARAALTEPSIVTASNPCPTPHKQAHPTKGKATAHLISLRRAKPTIDERPYLCPCGSWHIGAPRRRKPRRRR